MYVTECSLGRAYNIGVHIQFAQHFDYFFIARNIVLKHTIERGSLLSKTIYAHHRGKVSQRVTLFIHGISFKY